MVFYPKSQEDYITLKDDIFSQLDDSICAEAPEYKPTARIEFLCENEEYRRSVFEKVNIALADKRSNFTTNRLSKDAKELRFAFNFFDIDERDNIENIIEGLLLLFMELKFSTMITTIKESHNGHFRKTFLCCKNWIANFSQTLEMKMLITLMAQLMISWSEVDEEELAHSRYSKESIVRRRRRQYLQKQA